ncbi:MAG: hypothetical protein ABI972_03220 [Acidobacteriota bacterium]
MFRFDELIHPRMTVREVVQRWPATGEVIENFGFRTVCHDCDLQTVARRQEIAVADVFMALNAAAFGAPAEMR